MGGKLKGKIEVIKGRKKGMGEEKERMFEERGEKGIVIWGSYEEKGREKDEGIEEMGEKEVLVKVEIEKVEEWRRIVEEDERELGRIDIMVNEEGMKDRGNIMDK